MESEREGNLRNEDDVGAGTGEACAKDGGGGEGDLQGGGTVSAVAASPEMRTRHWVQEWELEEEEDHPGMAHFLQGGETFASRAQHRLWMEQAGMEQARSKGEDGGPAWRTEGVAAGVVGSPIQDGTADRDLDGDGQIGPSHTLPSYPLRTPRRNLFRDLSGGNKKCARKKGRGNKKGGAAPSDEEEALDSAECSAPASDSSGDSFASDCYVRIYGQW